MNPSFAVSERSAPPSRPWHPRRVSAEVLGRVSDLREGEPARLRGRVRRAAQLLSSPLGERPCVCWELREGFGDDAPSSAEAVDFLLDDGTGAVLVRGTSLDVDARAERRETIVAAVDRDVNELGQRQRAVKRAIRRGEGDLRALHAERRRLAEQVTLLCAIRAHARRRVHIGGSPAGQQRWIDAHAREVGDSGAPASLRLVAERWEIALEEGHEIEVEGVCEREMTVEGGYRGQASRLVVRAPPGGTIRVRGVGASAPAASPPPAERARRAPRSRPRARPASVPTDRIVLAIVTGVCAVGALLAWWLS